jgi:hypothetical protein
LSLAPTRATDSALKMRDSCLTVCDDMALRSLQAAE